MSTSNAPDDLLTRKVKLFADITARMGFPMVISLALLYLYNSSIKEQVKALYDLRATLVSMDKSIQDNTDSVKRMVAAIYRTRKVVDE